MDTLTQMPVPSQELAKKSEDNLDDLPVAVADEEEDGEFRIEQLFGSKTRARLLGLFLENADRPFYVRELARRIEAQLNSVRRELKNLLDIGIVLEVDGTPPKSTKEVADKDGEEEGEGRIEKKRYYKANPNFPIFDDLRAVMKKVAVLMNRSLLTSLESRGSLDLLVLTGRFTDAANMPTDILVVGDIPVEAVQQAIVDFEREIGREVNYTFMPRDEYQYRVEVGDRFLLSILGGKRVVLKDHKAGV